MESREYAAFEIITAEIRYTGLSPAVQPDRARSWHARRIAMRAARLSVFVMTGLSGNGFVQIFEYLRRGARSTAKAADSPALIRRCAGGKA